MLEIIGRYNAFKYEIVGSHSNGNEEFLYQAGNSPYDSEGYVSADKGVGLETMRKYCGITAKEFAKEYNCEFVIEPLEEEDEDIE